MNLQPTLSHSPRWGAAPATPQLPCAAPTMTRASSCWCSSSNRSDSCCKPAAPRHDAAGGGLPLQRRRPAHGRQLLGAVSTTASCAVGSCSIGASGGRHGSGCMSSRGLGLGLGLAAGPPPRPHAHASAHTHPPPRPTCSRMLAAGGGDGGGGGRRGPQRPTALGGDGGSGGWGGGEGGSPSRDQPLGLLTRLGQVGGAVWLVARAYAALLVSHPG